MSRGYGVKYQNKDLVYVSLKKHYCPHCKTKVKTVTVEKVVERNSPEANDFDFRFGTGGTHFTVDKAKFKWKESEVKFAHFAARRNFTHKMNFTAAGNFT